MMEANNDLEEQIINTQSALAEAQAALADARGEAVEANEKAKAADKARANMKEQVEQLTAKVAGAQG